MTMTLIVLAFLLMACYLLGLAMQAREEQTRTFWLTWAGVSCAASVIAAVLGLLMARVG